MPNLKRSQIETYLNITPESPTILESASATYALVGEGVSTLEVDMGAKSEEYQNLAEDAASSTLEDYAPSAPVEHTAILNDPVFDYVNQLYLDQAIFDEAESTIVEVQKYETGTPPSYPAFEQKVAIPVEDIGDAAGDPVKLNYKFIYIGDPIPGTFNITTKVFTAS